MHSRRDIKNRMSQLKRSGWELRPETGFGAPWTDAELVKLDTLYLDENVAREDYVKRMGQSEESIQKGLAIVRKSHGKGHLRKLVTTSAFDETIKQAYEGGQTWEEMREHYHSQFPSAPIKPGVLPAYYHRLWQSGSVPKPTNYPKMGRKMSDSLQAVHHEGLSEIPIENGE